MNAGSEDDLVAAVGYGGFAVNTVLIKLLELHKKDLQKQEEKTNSLAALEKLKTKKPVKHNGTGILVKGEPGLLVRLAKCCSPVPATPSSASSPWPRRLRPSRRLPECHPRPE